MKLKILLTTFILLASVSTGCKQAAVPKASPSPSATPKQTTPAEASPDVKTTASIVDTEANFKKAISNSGTWIIAITKDLTVTSDLVLDGEFKNGKKNTDGTDQIQRKVALYAQDENKKITARYTLTAPKITINSPKASLQHGTFKGDVYVNSKDFELIDNVVEGNVYFTTDDAKAGFKMDATSKITGKQEVKKP